MDVVAGAICPLLQKLGELLVSEFNLEKRVRKGVKYLLTELELMHAVLCKLGEVPADQLDRGVRIWAGKVQELSYKMEDAVDAFMVCATDGRDVEQLTSIKNRVKKFLKKTTKLFGKRKALRQISNAIEETRDLAMELSDLRTRYNLDMQSTNISSNIDPRLVDMYKDVTEFVGIEEGRDELIQKLIEGDEGSKQQLKTISIIGFGGLGKTTLAKAVYDKIMVQFDCQAFVSVSRNPDMKKILKDMLYVLDKDKFENIHSTTRDEKLLIDELLEFLKDKRYLLVIDDIWDEKTWGVIKCALPRNCLGSRIITTTRNISVSEACRSSGVDIIHTMKPISDIESRRLFYKRIFHSETACPNELQEVSRGILKKCAGVPLAIITMASLLASNQRVKSKDQWCHLLKTMGRGLTEGAVVEDMKRILSFSYYDLPSHLRSCLLYLSIFPEDYVIERQRLIWRWIAEGFIHHVRQEKSLFEVGESYFNELVNRSLIQPININYQDKARACRVHDMVLDLICSLSSEENFVTIWDGDARSIHDSQSKVRRLSLQNIGMAELNTTQLGSSSMPQVRSVSLFMPDVSMMPSLSSFQVLRVLDLEGSDLGGRHDKIDLRHLGNLLHLRYLGLRKTSVGELPIENGTLQVLQTLDIRDNKIRELSSSVFGLRQLVRLRFDLITKPPVWFGNELVSLEELSTLNVSYFSKDDFKKFGNLTELRVLKIFTLRALDEGECKSLSESLSNMQKLQSLKFTGLGHKDFMPASWVPPPRLRRFDPGPNSFRVLPKWMNASSLSLLCHLQITVDQVRGEDIQILGMMPALCYLYLWVPGAVEEELVDRRFMVTFDAFPCMRECKFVGFVTMPSMFPRGAMPMLKSFELWFGTRDIACGGVDQLCMDHLPSLQKVKANLWCKEASAGEVEEVEAALRLAADAHSNHPTVKIIRYANSHLK